MSNYEPGADLHRLYHDWVIAHPDAAGVFSDAVEDLLTTAGVTFDRVITRVKTWESFQAKSQKTHVDGSPEYPNPWEDIHDLVGVRVTTFHSLEIPVAVRVLSHAFKVLKSVDKAAETRVSGDFGYGSHHLVLRVGGPAVRENPALAEFEGHVFEVQVRTVLQHAWAEFEHDIRYKRGETSPFSASDPRVDRAFTLAAGLIELADQQFDQISQLRYSHLSQLDQLGSDGGSAEAEHVIITPDTLPGILALLLGDRFPRSRRADYLWLEQLLSANNVNTVGDLRKIIDTSQLDRIVAALTSNYEPGQVRVVDDLLLYRFGQQHIARTAHIGTKARRQQRLARRLEALKQADLLPGGSSA